MNSKQLNYRIWPLQALTNSVLPQPIKKAPVFANAGNGSICLTFDDGPDPAFTPTILDILADYDVKASFFVLGEAAAQFPHLVERMVKEGHSIGNHTYSHQHPWMISSECARQEVTRATEVIKSIIGMTPRWFRPPFGRLRTAMRKQAHQESMETVLWSHSIIDWGYLGSKSGITNRLELIKPCDIVLMHDGKRKHNHPDNLIRCLPQFLRELRKKSMVTANLDSLFLE